MQATKRQVLAALTVGLVLLVAGLMAAWGAFNAEVLDAQVGFGLASASVLFVGFLLIRAGILEIRDAIQD